MHAPTLLQHAASFAALVALASSPGALAGCSRDAHSQPRPPSGPAPQPVAAAARDAATAPATPAGPASPGARPAVRNVVLLSIDCLRADMPWAGYPRPIAPNLTAAAARAVQYTHAYSLSSYTSQSVAGMLSGRLASELRRDGAFFNRFARDNVFFPELLHDAGVRTVAAHTHFYFRAGFAGFEQGFDVWEMLPGGHVDYTTDLDITSDRHEALAERILSNPANTSGRFFAWFHFTDPHDRYLPHRGIGPYGRRLRDLYDAEVTFTDQYVGRLLDFIAHQPWAGQTAIIITADHGEAFGEHHMYRHAFELWQPLVRVPLLLLLPGAAPRTIEANRSQIDLAPTILELFGVARPADMRGTSLLAEAYGAATPERDVWIDHAQTSVSHRRRALVRGNTKLIAFDYDERFMVFDLAADPDEATSLRGTDRARYDDMLARYRAGQGAIRDYVPPQFRDQARH